MKHYLTFTLALLSFSTVFAKEFPSMKDFEANKGSDEINRRHWVSCDRMSNNKAWKEACLFNFSYATGYNEYRSMEEREDFYRWAADTLRKQGHQIKWVEMALVVVDLVEPAAKGKGKVSQYALAGSKLVFDSSFVRLQQLFRMEKPLKNEAAKAWDDEMIRFEQEDLVQNMFNSMDIVTLEKISKMAKGEGIYSLYTKKALRFKGDLRSSSVRIEYAQKQLLPYVNDKINAAQRKRLADNGISAEDARSIKAAEKYLDTLEKEKSTETEDVAPAKP